MKRIKIFFILSILMFCMAFNCKTVEAKFDLDAAVAEEYEVLLEGDYTPEEFKEMLKEKYTPEEYEKVYMELMKKIITAVLLGDAEVKLTPEEIEEMDNVVNIVWDGTGDAKKKSPKTPSMDWVNEEVDAFKESLYQESKTTAEVIVRETAKDELSFEKVIGGAIFDMGVSHSTDKLKELTVTKGLEMYLGDADKAKKKWGAIDAVSDMVKYINGIGKAKQIIEANEPDMILQLCLQVGDTFSLTVDNHTDVIWDFNSKSWKRLMETEAYKQFVEEHKDNFGQAFRQATWEGWGQCFDHLSVEMEYLAADLSKLFTGIEESGGLFEWLRGKIKPTKYVNVYKPNIYLYSDEPMEVDVKFTEEQWLTETIPEYSLGWYTRLHGDGDITCQNEQYDFLFYESIASKALVVDDGGFIVEASNREEQLRNILALYDFNAEETEDFIEFWMEMLEENVDYVMYPQDTACVDKQMPIVITPKPEQITRLWFAFEEYDGQEVKAPQITPIVREGFTVVEWGGFFLD